jgi:sRNA-binding protein
MTESNAAATDRIRAQLAERWPALFNPQKPAPLAIGINDALLAALPDITAGQLRRVLGGWCSRPRYLAALTAGADRHGLEGVQGAVTEEQAADAAERFKAVQAVFREKDEAKRKAEQARQAEARKKTEKLEAQKAEPPPAPPKPAPAAPKPAGPVIMVKKRRLAGPATEK